MNTLRLPQYSIDTSGMRKSHSLEPLKPFNEARRDSSPLPNVLQTFANNFNSANFDLLRPWSKTKSTRSKSTETIFRDTDYNEKQQNRQDTAQKQEQVALSQSGLIRGATAKYLLRDGLGDGDIKLELELEPVRYRRQRSVSLDAPIEDLLTPIVSNDSKTHRSCVQLEKKEDDLCTLMEALQDKRLLQHKSVNG